MSKVDSFTKLFCFARDRWKRTRDATWAILIHDYVSTDFIDYTYIQRCLRFPRGATPQPPRDFTKSMESRQSFLIVGWGIPDPQPPSTVPVLADQPRRRRKNRWPNSRSRNTELSPLRRLCFRSFYPFKCRLFEGFLCSMAFLIQFLLGIEKISRGEWQYRVNWGSRDNPMEL